MREILFRGKRKDNGDWIYGDLRNYSENSKGIFDYETKHTMHVIPETVGQYTGLKDVNGNGTRIFEGDIVKSEKGICFSGEYTAVVKFHNGEFLADSDTVSFYAVDFCILEVIGNIHDNPELLKGEDK